MCLTPHFHVLLPQNGPAGTNLSLLSRNPLAATHEFRQACHACYSRIGWFKLPTSDLLPLTSLWLPTLFHPFPFVRSQIFTVGCCSNTFSFSTLTVFVIWNITIMNIWGTLCEYIFKISLFHCVIQLSLSSSFLQVHGWWTTSISQRQHTAARGTSCCAASKTQMTPHGRGSGHGRHVTTSWGPLYSAKVHVYVLYAEGGERVEIWQKQFLYSF